MQKSQVLETLKGNVGLKNTEDGQLKGKFDKLSKKHFSSPDVYELYKAELCYANALINKSVEAQSEEDAARLVNMAREKHIIPAYKLLEKECMLSGVELPEGGFTVSKRHVRAWLFTGATARVKTDYNTCETDVVGKSWTSLARYVERDISDILNGRPRLEKAKLAKVVQNQVDKALKAAAEAEAAKQAAEAEAEQTTEPAA